jgi:hypothetical protein
MFMSMKVKQIDSAADHVALTFRCRGDTETNYDGFLSDATDAAVSLFETYSTGTVRKPQDRAKLRQRVTNALDRTFKDLR